jgi:hypothetical protein
MIDWAVEESMVIRPIYVVKGPFDEIHLFEFKGLGSYSQREFQEICQGLVKRTTSFSQFVKGLERVGFKEISPQELNGYFDYPTLCKML